MKAYAKKYILKFKRPSGTSRGVLRQKETWFVILEKQGKYGIGECGILRGLSIDDRPDYEAKLNWACKHIGQGLAFLCQELTEFPSIQFGLEQAFMSLDANTPFELFPSNFIQKESPIAINGLIWMGSETFMHQQIKDKIASGFSCIKLKIGAIDFDKEFKLLEGIRSRFSSKEIELRVDANGAFGPEEAAYKLNKLSKLELHSIEQPIAVGQWEQMTLLCKNTSLPIALDEELIGIYGKERKRELLVKTQPQYIILKPSLIGGFSGALEWISLAEDLDVKWWVTSALESNIGLNAIAQWTYTLQNKLPQGLGTGSLFTNNLGSPLEVSNGKLYYRKHLSWQSNLIEGLCL
ncbi:O-succinylbenzoate synthase [Croceitalea dokdonensis DOKDO 023]|uniref:O-succinylbenzoate synthase n=1 Tax=Croceitalea dokdonensis DOKDO 023 TaxID=1300341 RepID=A0A0P7AMT6_9FLAO|nr:o-succinylbenzoate synthase [Croceitalea dokdonensis]KPM33222.1 O-succinylbenzoate synthase [Croceitalea dokdonensis DOKDO 023]